MLHHEGLTTSETNQNNELLVQSVVRQDIFADDSRDEFRIRREDGQEQGIFKVWAAPVIAQLEGMDPVTWANELREKPLSLFECLETWRATAAQADRRLQKIFDDEPLPTSIESAASELFARLTAAFAMSAPFYHIEAMVADNRADKPDNPINFSGDAIVAGKLDAVAMLLPAALQSHVTAKPGDWQGLNWEQIHDTAHGLDANKRDVKVQAVLQRVANLASLDVEAVLFVANALEFIPQQVGGKAADFTQENAIELLNNVLDESSSDMTTTKIAKDMNAMIRFLNWTPAIRSDANFSGKNWMYDSVCATAAELLELVRDNAALFFGTEFAEVFKGKLIPQLDGIDAMSAKGRFMLQMLHEGAFTAEATQRIGETIDQRVPELLASLDERQKKIDFDDFSSVSQVGGKAIGLKNAVELFGKEAVVPSKVMPVDAVNEWLAGIGGVSRLLQKLESDAENRADIAEQIRMQIMVAEPPHSLLESFTQAIDSDAESKLAFRSSSFDEDVDVIGPAPGIYESVIDINPKDSQVVGDAFKNVVASFFTAKAVHFRDAKGLRHKPVMAVLGQKMVEGPGGSVFIQGDHRIMNIAETPAALNDHSQAHAIESIDFLRHREMKFFPGFRISTHTMTELIDLGKQAESVLGPVDMEFVCDSETDKLMILQLRRLERPAHSIVKRRLGQTALLSASRLSELTAMQGDDMVTLVVDQSDDVEKFQGELFKSIVTSRNRIASIRVSELLPPTCHFVNILMTMGITVEFVGDINE
jgi:hypothetical protein